MTIELKEDPNTNILKVNVSGKLMKEDYEEFVPMMERLIKQHGKLKILLEMHDFHGWELSALWEDIKFDINHFSDISCLAMVGESKWEHGMAIFCKPFTMAKIKYFDKSEAEQAEAWIKECR